MQSHYIIKEVLLCFQKPFFFFSWCYNPWWVLACFTILFHNLLSLHFSNPFRALVVLFCICRNYHIHPSQQRKFFQGVVASRTPNPLSQRTGVSLLVWIITFDLSGKGGPTSNYATAGIALPLLQSGDTFGRVQKPLSALNP